MCVGGGGCDRRCIGRGDGPPATQPGIRSGPALAPARATPTTSHSPNAPPRRRFATEFQGVSGHCSPPAPASLDVQAKGWWACPRGGVRPLCAPVRCAIRRCSRTCLIVEVIGPTRSGLPASPRRRPEVAPQCTTAPHPPGRQTGVTPGGGRHGRYLVHPSPCAPFAVRKAGGSQERSCTVSDDGSEAPQPSRPIGDGAGRFCKQTCRIVGISGPQSSGPPGAPQDDGRKGYCPRPPHRPVPCTPP